MKKKIFKVILFIILFAILLFFINFTYKFIWNQKLVKAKEELVASGNYTNIVKAASFIRDDETRKA